jgi:hypothetical protein
MKIMSTPRTFNLCSEYYCLRTCEEKTSAYATRNRRPEGKGNRRKGIFYVIMVMAKVELMVVIMAVMEIVMTLMVTVMVIFLSLILMQILCLLLKAQSGKLFKRATNSEN